MVCGRQDETLRIVSLPYVFSVIVITFRRAFMGMWCRRHRTLRTALAGFITSFFGWIGVPYGLVFSPVVLFKLARGGDMPIDANTKMMKDLSDHKLKQGDVQGAVRCMEAVLRLAEDDEDANQRLSDLYRRYASLKVDVSSMELSIILAILGAIVIGSTIGFLEFLTGMIFGSVLSGETDILGVILSWIPFVGTVLLGGILLAQGMDWVFERLGRFGRGFGTGLALIIAVLSVYAIPTGLVLSEYIQALLTGMKFASISEALMTTGAVLSRGGAWVLADAARNWATADIIFIFVLIIALGFYGASNVSITSSIARWRERLAMLRPQAVVEGAASSWQGLAVLLVVTLVMVVFYGGFMNVPRLTRSMSGTRDLIELGDALYEQGDFAGAAQAFEEAAAMDPDDVWSRVYLGWTYFSQGKLNDATRAFVEALSIDPGLVEAHLGYGFLLSSLEDYEKAVEHLEFVVQKTSDPILLSQAYFVLGGAYFALEDVEKAIQYAQQGITLDPANAYLHLNLAWYYLIEDDLEDALASYEQALRLDSTVVEAILGLGMVYYVQEDYERAIDEFQRAIGMAQEKAVLASAHLSLGRCHSALGDIPEALAQYGQALALEPDNLFAQVESILAHFLKGEFEVAQEEAEQLIVLHPTSAAGYALKAYTHYQLDQLTLMDQMLEKAHSLRGEDEDSLFLLAFVYSETLRFAEAELVLKEVFELTRDQEPVLIHLVQVYNSQKRLDLARATADELRELTGETVDYELVEASIAIEELDFDRALNALGRALDLDPEEWQVHNGLSYVYFQQGRSEEALLEAQEALRLFRYSSGNYKNLAFAHHAVGDLELALEAAKESVRLEPKYDLAHYILGLCYMDMGEQESARLAFEKFLDLYWDRANAREYKEKAEAYLEQLK